MNNSTNSNGNGSKKSKFSNIFTLVSSLLIAGTIACSQPGVSIDKIIPKKPEVKAEVVEKKESSEKVISEGDEEIERLKKENSGLILEKFYLERDLKSARFNLGYSEGLKDKSEEENTILEKKIASLANVNDLEKTITNKEHYKQLKTAYNNIYKIYYDFIVYNLVVSEQNSILNGNEKNKGIFYNSSLLQELILKLHESYEVTKEICGLYNLDNKYFNEMLENIKIFDLSNHLDSGNMDDFFKMPDEKTLKQLLLRAERVGKRTEHYLWKEMDSNSKHSGAYGKRVGLNQNVNQLIKILELTLFHDMLADPKTENSFLSQNQFHKMLFEHNLAYVIDGVDKFNNNGWDNYNDFKNWAFSFMNFCHWANQVYRTSPQLKGYLKSKEIFGKNGVVDTPNEILYAINGIYREFNNIYKHHNIFSSFNFKSFKKGMKNVLLRAPVDLLAYGSLKDNLDELYYARLLLPVFQKRKVQRPLPKDPKKLVQYLDEEEQIIRQASYDEETTKKLEALQNYNFMILSELYFESIRNKNKK